MHNGCILCGSVGSGKTITSLAYYGMTEGMDIYKWPYIIPTKEPRDLIVITTAKKRDELEWEGDMSHFLLSPNPEVNGYSNRVIIDSWNNIKKYTKIHSAFFIFDEQRLVGSGAWVKAFYNIARKNRWILLSATPGDSWSDYIPVFVANGFYKNKTEFNNIHVEWDRYSKYPKVKKYHNTGRLIRQRRDILVKMDYTRTVEKHFEDVFVPYDISKFKDLMKNRWNYEKEKPIENASELCYELRKIVNKDISRIEEVKRIQKEKKRIIVFYNFDYELDILLNADYGPTVKVSQWNGHRHEKVPTSSEWVYLVQYTSGCEGWNCITTDTIIFYSLNYSYKTMTQSSGRIDRMNSPYNDLYYFRLRSRSGIDLAISKALQEKRNFNESAFAA